MYSKKGDKLFYISISTILLLLLTVIGVLVYNTSPENGVKKDQNTETPSPSSLTNKDERKSADSLGMQPPRLSAANVNNISNAVLLGIFGWLSSDYAKQLAQNAKGNENELTFKLSRPHYVVAGVVLAAMVAYIGYFFYQKYRVEKATSYSLRKDVVIFALVSFLASVLFYPVIAEQLQGAAQGQEKLTQTLLEKIIMGFIGHACVYVLTIACIASIKSNHKIKLFDPEGFSMWAFSILALTSIHTVMHWSTGPNTFAKLLWAISACFLYVQVYSNVSIPSLGNETIDKVIAYLFQTSHLWEWLGCVFMVYHFSLPFFKVMGAWIAWECFKYALSHVDTQKDSDGVGYTANFPFSVTALLEGAFMILFVAFGLCNQFLPNALEGPWTKIAYGASVLAIGLCVSLYATVDKRSMVQWGALLSYGLLSIGGGVMAGYYIIWGGNAQNISLAIDPASLLVFGLYLIPKFLNRLAAASLTLKGMPEMMRKIAHTTQGFTAFWLQPNLEVLLVGVVMKVGLCFFDFDMDGNSMFTAIILIVGLGFGFVLYVLLQVYFYNKALLAEKKRALISHQLQALYLGLFALVIKVNTLEKGNKQNITTSPPWLNKVLYLSLFIGKYLVCYVLVVLGVQVLLDIVDPKDYKRTSLLLAKWKKMVSSTDKSSSMPKQGETDFIAIKQIATFCLSVLFVGYCFDMHEKSSFHALIGFLVTVSYIIPTSFNWLLKKIGKWAQAFQKLTAFWLQPDLDVVLCAAVVMAIGCKYEYETEFDNNIIQKIKKVYLLAMVAYLAIQLGYYYQFFSREAKLAGYLEIFFFGCTLAYIVALLATSGEDKMKYFLRSLCCVFCYLGIVVWIQSLLNTVGLKGYRRASLFPSLTGKDMYAIAVGFCNLFIQIGFIRWLLAGGHDYVPVSILLLVVTYGTYISIYLKLYQSLIQYRAHIVSYGMAVAYYAYATSFLYSEEVKVLFLPDRKTEFYKFFLEIVTLGLCAAIVVDYIAVYVRYNFTLAKIKGMLRSGYTSVCKFFLSTLIFLKGLFSTDVTSSTLSTDVVTEEITAAQVDPLYENIKITLVKNFPALFGMGMILLYNKNLLDASTDSEHQMASTYRLVIAVTVCGLALLYANVVLSEFDKKVGKGILAQELVSNLVLTVFASGIKKSTENNAETTIKENAFVLAEGITTFVLISCWQKSLFDRKELDKWRKKLSGLTLLTCVTAVHMDSFFPINESAIEHKILMPERIIYFCSSFIVLVSMFDTLQLSSVAKSDTWEGWFATHFCTYCPGILSASYVIGFHIWQTTILTSSKQKVACSLLFLLLFSGFKQLKVTAQKEGKLRFSPIAIDHNLLAQDLFMAFLLPFLHCISKDGLSNLSRVSYQDIAMSVLCTVVVRWGSCSGLITHLTKKQTEGSSKRVAHPKQASVLFMRRAGHSMLVVTCWLLIKGMTMSEITANHLLMFGVVALPFLSTYSKEITSIFGIKYIKQAMAFFYDVLYQNQNEIATFLIMAWLQTQLFVSDDDSEKEIKKQLKIFMVVACMVLVINMMTQNNYAKIFTHLIFWSFGLKGLMPLYKEEESKTYLLNICYLVVALAVEGLHPLPLRGKIKDIQDGVLTQINKHHLLLGAFCGLGIAIAPAIISQEGDLFNDNTLICVMVGVLIGFVSAVYGEKIAVWLGQEDRIAWIQGLCIFVSTAIAIRIQLGIAIKNDSPITKMGNFLAIFGIPFTILYFYWVCTLLIDMQQKRLYWLFRWSRADTLVDYVPLASDGINANLLSKHS